MLFFLNPLPLFLQEASARAISLFWQIWYPIAIFCYSTILKYFFLNYLKGLSYEI